MRRYGRCGRWATIIGSRRRPSGGSGPVLVRRLRRLCGPAGPRCRRGDRQRRHSGGAGGCKRRRVGYDARELRRGPARRSRGGRHLEWVEGDAEGLPFGDGEFDVVTSCFGAMFAPEPAGDRSELLRVCRPGGVIGMINFTPEGAGGDFFRVLERYAPPPPPGALSPLLWGTEDHVRKLFGESSVAETSPEYVETAPSSHEYSSCSRIHSGR